MNDYRLLYEDLLDMERRATEHGLLELANECFQFRVELLMRFYSVMGHAR